MQGEHFFNERDEFVVSNSLLRFVNVNLSNRD